METDRYRNKHRQDVKTIVAKYTLGARVWSVCANRETLVHQSLKVPTSGKHQFLFLEIVIGDGQKGQIITSITTASVKAYVQIYKFTHIIILK